MAKWFIISIVSLVLVGTASAQTTTEGIRGQIRDTRNQIRDLREDAAQDLRDLRGGLKQQVRDLRAGDVSATTTRDAIRDAREAFREEFEAKRAELKSRIEAEQASLKSRLAALKDQRKQQVVERIGSQVNDLNERTLRHLTDALGKLEKVLDRIEARTTKNEQGGMNVSAVRTAMVAAQAAIDAARVAITTQSGKVYSITVSGSDSLRADVGAVRRELHADLTKVRDAVKAARDAVHQAATTLAELRGRGGATSTSP